MASNTRGSIRLAVVVDMVVVVVDMVVHAQTDRARHGGIAMMVVVVIMVVIVYGQAGRPLQRLAVTVGK